MVTQKEKNIEQAGVSGFGDSAFPLRMASENFLEETPMSGTGRNRIGTRTGTWERDIPETKQKGPGSGGQRGKGEVLPG